MRVLVFTPNYSHDSIRFGVNDRKLKRQSIPVRIVDQVFHQECSDLSRMIFPICLANSTMVFTLGIVKTWCPATEPVALRGQGSFVLVSEPFGKILEIRQTNHIDFHRYSPLRTFRPTLMMAKICGTLKAKIHRVLLRLFPLFVLS